MLNRIALHRRQRAAVMLLPCLVACIFYGIFFKITSLAVEIAAFYRPKSILL